MWVCDALVNRSQGRRLLTGKQTRRCRRGFENGQCQRVPVHIQAWWHRLGLLCRDPCVCRGPCTCRQGPAVPSEAYVQSRPMTCFSVCGCVWARWVANLHLATAATVPGRVCRIGQDEPTFVHTFVMEGTIEEKILRTSQFPPADSRARAAKSDAGLLALLRGDHPANGLAQMRGIGPDLPGDAVAGAGSGAGAGAGAGCSSGSGAGSGAGSGSVTLGRAVPLQRGRDY